MAYGFNEDRSKVKVYTSDEVDAMDLANDQDLADEVIARQSDVGTLDSRISNIIAHGQSTESNTELIDIRAGYDGFVYDVAGDAVRQQNENLVGNFTTFNNCLASFTDAHISIDGLDISVDKAGFVHVNGTSTRSGVNTYVGITDGLTYKRGGSGITDDDVARTLNQDSYQKINAEAGKEYLYSIEYNDSYVLPSNDLSIIMYTYDSDNDVYRKALTQQINTEINVNTLRSFDDKPWLFAIQLPPLASYDDFTVRVSVKEPDYYNNEQWFSNYKFEKNVLAGMFELGTISTNGQDAVSNLSCRTRYVKFPINSIWKLHVADGYKAAIVHYDNDKNFVYDYYWLYDGASTYSNTWGWRTLKDEYFRFVVQAIDGSAVPISEVAKLITVTIHEPNDENVVKHEWTGGGLSNSGARKTRAQSPNRALTNFVHFDDGYILFENADDYGVVAGIYNLDETWVGWDPASYHYGQNDYMQVDKNHLYRFVARKSDDSNITSIDEVSNKTKLIFTRDKRFIDNTYNNRESLFNDENKRIIQQLAYSTNGRNSASTLPVLLHFSDIHSDSKRFNRIVEFAKNTTAVSDIVCTGDLVDTQWSSDFDYWTADDILIVMGNHDEIVNRSNWDNLANYKTMAEAYERYMAPSIANWGVTYEANKTYWYKDYSNFRLIALDLVQDYLSNDAVQMAWFQSVLESARAAGLPVVVANHFPAKNRTAVSGAGGWYDTVYSYSQNERWLVREAWQQAIETFKSNGGTFICWLTGHTHADLLSFNSNYPEQLFITIDTAAQTKASPYSNTARANDSVTQDCFNLISFDTLNHKIKVARIGASENMLMQHKKMLCFDYTTHSIVSVY